MASPPPDPHLPDPTSTSTITAAPDLYTALQANRALKDAEEAEKIKFANSFRGLEADEAEYLDGILEEERRRERERKEEERRELGKFRKVVEEKEKDLSLTVEETIGEVNWRKRKAGEGGKAKRLKLIGKKGNEKDLKSDSTGNGSTGTTTENVASATTADKAPTKTGPSPAKKDIDSEMKKDGKKEAPKAGGLASLLGDYDSDESDN